MLDETGGLKWSRLSFVHAENESFLKEQTSVGTLVGEDYVVLVFFPCCILFKFHGWCRASFEELVLDETGGLKWRGLETWVGEDCVTF